MNKSDYFKLQHEFTQTGGWDTKIEVFYMGLKKVVSISFDDQKVDQYSDDQLTKILDDTRKKVMNAVGIENYAIELYQWVVVKNLEMNIYTLRNILTRKDAYISASIVPRNIDLSGLRDNSFIQCLKYANDTKDTKDNLCVQYMQMYNKYKLATMTDEEKKAKLFVCLSDMHMYSSSEDIPKNVIDVVYNSHIMVEMAGELKTIMDDLIRKITEIITECATKFFNSNPPIDMKDIKDIKDKYMKDMNELCLILIHMDPLFITPIVRMYQTKYRQMPQPEKSEKFAILVKLGAMIENNIPDGTDKYAKFNKMCNNIQSILKKIY
jgi:hypothetical protein